ncbi:hypothetical protein [Pseudarthrobacter sp. MEB009]|uniref:hypothetical protein n=1 Tax=Pseudarthrobacter sp. MEB009 TaxID=3040326 RepID=UPI0025553199|nr:hypothetical protein [Pseudarthrobacter sp. MEB009]
MLQGYFDSISPDKLTLTGWIQVDPSGQPPALHFDRNGEVSGAAVFGHERADVVASLGVPNRVFTLSLDEPAESHHLLAKSHHVAAVVDGVRSPVQLGGRAYHQMMADFVTTASANSSGTREVILDALQVKESGLAKYARESAAAGKSGDLSYLGFPVGMRSGNDTAQLGRDGHLFLTGGSNALRDQYREPATDAAKAAMEEKAQRWEAALDSNAKALAELGIPFLQVMIPEKLTALRHLAPLPISGPTPLYNRVDELMAGKPGYLNFLGMFDGWDNEIGAWQRNDTHCSPAGFLAMTRAMLERLPGCDPRWLDGVGLTETTYRDGDLSAKFFDVPLWDKQYRPAPDALGEQEITNVYSYSPGHFVGSHNIWQNSAPVSDKKVVVFGNSFFGGVESPTRLGWWFSRLFREYHMKWENALDLDYIRDVRPDYVIFQTIERFLVRPPAANTA